MPDENMILPATDDPDTAAFWAATREEKLTVQRCDVCGRLRFPPRPVCTCGSFSFTWREMLGKGHVWSFAVAHRPTLPAFEHLLPYPFVVIELAEAPHLRMVGNIVASPEAPINSVAPDDIFIGQDVTVAFRRVTDEVTLPVWVPVSRKEGNA